MRKSITEYLKGIDVWLVLAAIVSTGISIVLVYSATRHTSAGVRNIVIQQVCLVLGLVVMFIISKFDYDLYSDIAKYIVVIAVAALLFTAFFAPETKGNRNWLDFKIVMFQTSEITKFAFIVTMACHINAVKDKINNPKKLMFILLHFGAYALPIILQGDIGSLLVYVVMFLFMLYIAKLNLLYYLGAIVFSGVAIPIMWSNEIIIKGYMKTRILITLNPYMDPMKSGYQQIQSMIAVGSGKMNGSGLFKGIQTQYGKLPEKHTDFIYSVAGEELGFIGCVTIIGLLTFIIYRIIMIGIKSKNTTGMLICTGVATMLLVQTVENIGMCLSIMPVIGITLPFFSYGGSSLMSVFICLGLVLSVSLNTRHGLKFFEDN